MKIFVRLAALIFCRKVKVNNPDRLAENGPLLLACNHPNSFLDGVILDILFYKTLYSLARGDAFRSPFYSRILRSLKLLPVYRLSEGAENLSTNYDTFDECRELFRKNGIIIVYSEGKCINEWKLRPLKKGTARLAFSSWEENIPLRVLPVGINYSSFRRFGKNLFINFGNIITEQDFDMNAHEGNRHQQFNERLESELKKLVFDIDKSDRQKLTEKLTVKISPVKKVLFSLPAIAGWLIHLPLYLPLKFYTLKRANNDHYDSVITALLVFSYPFYLLLLWLIVCLLTGSNYSLLVFLLAPLCAWFYVQLKPQLDRSPATIARQ